jgi:hypothetical protein
MSALEEPSHVRAALLSARPAPSRPMRHTRAVLFTAGLRPTRTVAAARKVLFCNAGSDSSVRCSPLSSTRMLMSGMDSRLFSSTMENSSRGRPLSVMEETLFITRRMYSCRQHSPQPFAQPPASVHYSDAEVANRNVGDFGWESAHEALSRRPPISLDTIVARTHMYTYAAKVLGFVHRSGPFSVAPCQSLTFRFATFASLYGYLSRSQ